MAEKKNVVLSVKDLKINFSTDHGYVQAVRGISFDLYKGETLCIVGESGSGKSVTSKAIMGILAANGHIVGGSIMYQGEDLTKVSEDEFHRIRGHKIGMIFQDPLSSLNPIVRIGKQITEAMLINNNRLKKKYEELIAVELVAYKNAITEKKTGIAKAKENIQFLKSEKKKKINQIKDKASQIAAGKKFSLKREYKNDVLHINGETKSLNSPFVEQLKSKPVDCESIKAQIDANNEICKQKVAERTAKYKADLNAINLEKKESQKEVKAKVNEVTSTYADLILKAKETAKVTKKELTEKYNPLIKQNKAIYNAKCKEAKKEVNAYHKSLKDKYKQTVDSLRKERLKGHLTFKKIKNYLEFKKTAKSNYIASIKITKAEAKAKALKIMEEVGIRDAEKRFKQYPFEFSGGMRQRIVIAIALTADPDILICDEPTTALDVTIQAQILELINRIKEARKMSVIFITHDLGVVANMADRVAVMYAGKVVEYGTEKEIFYEPKHPYTWALLSSIPDVDSKEKLDAIPGTPPNMIYPPKGDAFALRSKYAMAIDFKKEPPMFKVSETHFAATWLLDPRAPKVEMPAIVKTRIENSLRAAKKEAN